MLHADGFSRLAAVKVLHPKWTQNTEIASRMRDEARLLGMLRHRNIVDVFDLTRIDGRAAVVMEYLEAVDTKVLVSEHRRAGQRLPLRSVLQIGADVASALDAAYNRPPYAGEKPLRVIHRDIKPSNIMVDGSGVTKVLDFGVARAEFDTREARTQEMSFGSSEYMAPERLFFEPDTPSSDVYSLGATLYELLALQKLGKAKLRATKQEAWFEERFEDLLERYPMASEEQEDMVHDLLYDMLAFEEASRPTAADCVGRLRALARACDQAGLDEWAEGVIPQLVQKYETKQLRRKDGESTSLVDRVVTEDKRGFAPAESEAEEDPSAAFDELKAQSLASMAGQGRDESDAGWAKEAPTLSSAPVASVEPSLDPPPRTAETTEVPASVPPPVPDALAQAATSPLLTGDPALNPSAGLQSQVETLEMPVDGLVDDGFEDEPPTEVGGAGLIAALAESRTAEDVTVDTATGPTDLPLGGHDAATTQLPRHRPPAATPVMQPMVADATTANLGRPSARSMVPVLLGAAALLVVLLTVVVVLAAAFVFSGSGERLSEPSPVVTEAVVEGALEPGAPEPVVGEADAADGMEPEAAAAEPPEIPNAPASAEGDEGAAPTGGVTFSSALSGTKKMVVRCDSASESGTDTVTISESNPGTCTVSRIGEDRSRQQAVVPDVESGSYTCFANGAKTCEPNDG